MPPETEAIKQQMEQTRAALTEKLATLEQKVIATVQDTTSTVASTVHAVGATVRDTVHDVRFTVGETMATVKEILDVSRQMGRHPWLMLGASVFVGYLGGRLLERVEGGRSPPRGFLPAGPGEKLLANGSEAEREERRSEAASVRSSPSFLKALADIFAPEIAKLKRVALGVTIGLVRDKLTGSVPVQLKADLTDLMDRVTVKLGGEPTPPGSISIKGEDHEERNGAEMARSLRTT
jgi:hypothetical protein